MADGYWYEEGKVREQGPCRISASRPYAISWHNGKPQGWSITSAVRRAHLLDSGMPPLILLSGLSAVGVKQISLAALVLLGDAGDPHRHRCPEAAPSPGAAVGVRGHIAEKLQNLL